MAATLARDARAEVYADLQGIIHKVVGRFCHLYGTDFEDYLSLANLTFLRCFKIFDANLSTKFSTFVHSRIWFAMMEQRRTDARSRRIHKIQPDADVDTLTEEWKGFSLVDFMDELNSDCQMVVELVFSRDVQLALLERKVNGRMTSRSVIREVLEDLGWTQQRIVETFDEIASAL